MIRNLVSIVFVVMFMASFTLPTVFYALDLDITKVVQVNIAEEEENDSDKLKEIEVLAHSDSPINEFFAFQAKKTQTAYYSKFYKKPHLLITFPPPDVFLIS